MPALDLSLAILSDVVVPTPSAGGGLNTLLTVAIVFFVIAILAYVLGAKGVAGMTAGLGRTLLFVFLILAVLLILVNLFR
jgi:uncharacterized membrane protein YtjA (UPF0391 family)